MTVIKKNIISKLRCISCKDNKITQSSNKIICNNCGAEYSGDVAPIFINPSRLEYLNNIIYLNLNDRPPEDDNHGAKRMHGKDIYINSGYADRLLCELSPKIGSLILDLGCGRGHISEYFLKKGFDVLSIDIVSENLADTMNPNKLLASIDDLPIQSNSVDCIVCTDVFEHLEPNMVEDVISEAYRVLVPGGKMLISFPGNNLPNITGVHLMNLGIFFIRLFDKRVEYLDWVEPPAHINMSYPWKIKKQFKNAGFVGAIRPYSNKYLSLPRVYLPITKILNSKYISMFFVHLMHGVLIKPKL